MPHLDQAPESPKYKHVSSCDFIKVEDPHDEPIALEDCDEIKWLRYEIEKFLKNERVTDQSLK